MKLNFLTKLSVKFKGALGNTLDITVPEGDFKKYTTITTFAGGVGTPNLAPVFEAISGEEYDFIACPYHDDIPTIHTAMRDRWGYVEQTYGHMYSAATADAAFLQGIGLGNNSEFISIIAVPHSLTPNYIIAASIAGVATTQWKTPPNISRPLQTLVLPQVKPVAVKHRLSVAGKEALLNAGISTTTVNANQEVVIDRLTTLYQFNSSGAQDRTWFDAVKRHQSMYFVRTIRNDVMTEHGRNGLTSDNSPLTAGSNISLLRDIKATIVAS